MNNAERARFVHDLYEFNDSKPAPDTYRTMWEIRSPTLNRKRDPIVDIHGWCLMDNHYHLMLSETQEGGVSRFLRKLNVGYAMYFNEKHQRSGALFQGRTKKVHIERQAHFLYMLHYIHLNPLDLRRETGNWRAGKIADPTRAIAHLQQYRWSSYLDYCGTANFPSILSTELFADVFGNYERTIAAYLNDLELTSIKRLFLE